MVPGSTSRNGSPGLGSRRPARLGRSGWAGALIVALCVLAQWPGVFSIPPVDRDESRFAQATRQIVEAARAGDVENVIVPRVQARARLNKPPLIYWVQAVPAAAFDTPERGLGGGGGGGGLPTGNIWAFRLPSLLCAMLAAVLTWRMGLAMRLHPLAATLGGVFMATCVIEMVDARQARADQLLLALTTATQLCLWRVWDGRGKGRPARASLGWALGFWVFLALGVMTKGPITPMVAGLTVLALSVWERDVRWVRRLRPLVGLALVVVVVAAWVVPVARFVGFREYWSIVWGETAGRAGAARESHWGPPGYHLVLLVVLLFPGTLFTLDGMVRAIRRVFGGKSHTLERVGSREKPSSNQLPLRLLRGVGRLGRRRGGRGCEVFLLAWIVPSWVVFEVVATKLPHYTLPLYPAVALVSARALVRAAACGSTLARDRGVRAGMVVYLVLAAAIVIGAPGALLLWGGARWVAVPIGIGGLLLVGGAVGMWSLGREGALVRAQWLVIAATVVASVCVFGVLLPTNPNLWVSSRVVRLMDRLSAPEPLLSRPIGASGYREDSLVFLTRGRLEGVRRDDVGAWLAAHPDGLLVAPVSDTGAEEHGSESRATSGVAGAVRGFNYSKGQWVRLEVFGTKSKAGE